MNRHLIAPHARGSVLIVLLLSFALCAHATDCNENGIEDSLDISQATSLDCNGDLIPDECQFLEQHILSMVPYLSSVLPIDLEPDGDLDLLASSLQGLYSYENVHPDSQLVQHLLSFDNSPARSLLAEDLNGDGMPDPVADLGGDLRIFIALGGGAYDQVSLASGFNTIDAICCSDLDGDGLKDLIVASNSAADLSWFRQTEFGFQQQWITAAWSGVTHVASADMDADGDMDLVMALYDDDEIRLLLNSGTPVPVFSPMTISQTVGGPLHMDLADLNGDGTIDVAVTAYGVDEVHMYHNSGDNPPLFSKQTLNIEALGAWSIEARDLDGDSDMDLLVTHKLEHAVWWYANDGATVPFFTPEVLSENVLFVQEAWAGDLYNNGLQDILVPSRSQHEVISVSEFVYDCNGNGVADWCDISQGSSEDCNGNGRPDECEADCNGNGVPDHCDLSSGLSLDQNQNSIPDECETPKNPHLNIAWEEAGLRLSWQADPIATRYQILGSIQDSTEIIIGSTTESSYLFTHPYVLNRLLMSFRIQSISEAP